MIHCARRAPAIFVNVCLLSPSLTICGASYPSQTIRTHMIVVYWVGNCGVSCPDPSSAFVGSQGRRLRGLSFHRTNDVSCGTLGAQRPMKTRLCPFFAPRCYTSSTSIIIIIQQLEVPDDSLELKIMSVARHSESFRLEHALPTVFQFRYLLPS
jgi:hypothetical protein